MPYMPRVGSATAAYGVESVRATGRKPSGRRSIESPWLIQTDCSGSSPAETVLGDHRYECGPELLAFERHDLAAEGLGHEMQAVADAEDWNAAAPERGVGVGRAFLVDAGRPAGQDYGLGLAGCDLTPWSVEGKQLRVDVEIAHAAGYEAAGLAARVKDDDCVDV